MIRSFYDSLAGRLEGIRRLVGRADGQALVEVALVVSLTSMLALGTISVTGSNVRAVLGTISGSVTAPQAGQTTTQTATTPTPPAGKKKKKKG